MMTALIVCAFIVLYVVIGYLTAQLAGIIIMILDWLWEVPIINAIEDISDFFDKDDTPEERF